MAAGVRAGTAYAEIVPKLASGFAGDLDKQFSGPVEQSGGRVGASLGKIAGLIGGAFAAKGIFDFGKNAIAAATESNKIAAQTEAVIKSTGGAAKVTADQIGGLASAISNKTGVDDEAIQTGQNLLLTFTNLKNGVGKGNDIFNQATKTMVDMGAALGTDASGAAIQLGKALNDPIKGIAALSRVGVSFTDQQKDQIKAMVASGDQMGAQKIILGELNKEFGGSAEAQATAGDRLRVMWGNVQEQIGNQLLPIFDKVATFLMDKIPRAIAVVQPFVDTLKTGIMAFVSAVKDGDVTSDGFVGKMEMIGDAIHRALPFIKDIVINGFVLLSNWWAHWGPTIIGIATTVWTALQEFARIAIAAVTAVIDNWNKIEPIIKAIAILVAVVMIPQWIAAGIAALASAATHVAAWVIINAAMIAGTIVSSAQMAIQVAKWIWMGAAAMANAVIIAAAWLLSLGPIAIIVAAVIAAVALIIVHWDTIKDAAAAVFNWVKDNWPLLLAILTGPIGLAVLAIVKNWDTIKDAVTGVKDWIVARWNDVVGFVTGLPGKISAAAAGMWDGIKDAFKGVLNTIIGWWNGLDFALPKVHIPGTPFDVGGFTLGTPDIPKFAGGGVANWPAGQPRLSIIHGGEEVITASDRAAGAAGGFHIGEVNLIGTRATPAELSAELAWYRKTAG